LNNQKPFVLIKGGKIMGEGGGANEEYMRNQDLVVFEGGVLLRLQEFNSAFKLVMHDDWRYTQYQIGGMGESETFLKPSDGCIGDNHRALLYCYEGLEEQLSKRQFRIIPSGLIRWKHLGEE
jgi:hypothetical protein